MSEATNTSAPDNKISSRKTDLKIILLLTALIVALGLVFLNLPDPGHKSKTANVESALLPESRNTTIVAVGDILLSRHIGTKIDEAEDPLVPFRLVQELLRSADITFGNLECPFAPSEIPLREGLIFRCLPKYLPGLTDSGFDVLGTANNHALDQGQANLEFTTQYLRDAGILTAGTGKDHAQAHAPAILERNKLKFAFLSYSYTAKNDGGKSALPQIADFNDIPQMREDVWLARKEADVIIVNMHAGIEYAKQPTASQTGFAHAAIDAGADVVVGEHPHWIQTPEIYKGRPIFYSLGNFVFDQEWSKETKEGLAVELTFSETKLESAKLLPMIIENNCCPRLASEEESLNILQKINLSTTALRFDNKIFNGQQ